MRYLTAKAERAHPMDFVWIPTSLLFTVAGISVLGDYMQEGKTSGMTTTVVLVILFFWPTFSILRRRRRVRHAREISRYLASEGRRRVLASQIEKAVPGCKAAKEIRWLVNKDFMRDLHVEGDDTIILDDLSGKEKVVHVTEQKTVYITRPEPELKPDRYVSVKCPNCGATIRVKEGGDTRCDYCDTTVSG